VTSTTVIVRLVQRARFAVWAARLRAGLRRHGATLRIEGRAPFASAPRVTLLELGEGGGTTHLRFAPGVSLGRDMELVLWTRGDNRLELGPGAYFQRGVRVELRGGSVALGAHTHVHDGAVLKSQGELLVGEEVTISFGDVLACTERIEIGDLCGLGERVTVIDSDHTHDGSDHHWLRQPLRVAPVRLGRNVLVSANAVVLKGAEIGDNAVVAAGAVVPSGAHPAAHLLAGIPAAPVRPLVADESRRPR
jgi:acetyltransferase-like isoleucine patch superfamily enzyme